MSNNALPQTLQTIKPDAVEIHTEINWLDSLKQVANILKTEGIELKKMPVSCGSNQSQKGPKDHLKALWGKYEILVEHNVPVIWQLDGRPMSGDLAPATGNDAVKLWINIGS